MRDTLKDGLAVGAAIVIALLLKIPLLYNADASYHSDEATNGLLIKQLLDRGELVTHSWGTSYSGILEHLLAIPFVKILGFSALSFKLAPAFIFSLWIWITYLLGKSLGGRPLAIVSSILLACSPPMIVFWSQDFGGALTATHCLGMLSFYLLHRSINVSHTHRSLLACLAFVLGLGLYSNMIFVVYLVPIGLHYLLGAAWWRALRSGRTESQLEFSYTEGASPSAIKATSSRGSTFALCVVAFLVGFAPRIYHIVWGPSSAVRPRYRMAGPSQIQSNLQLLLKQCLPSIMGFDPFDNLEVALWTGNPSGSAVLYVWSLVTFAIIALAFLNVLYAYRRELLAAVALRPAVISVPAQMVILLFAVPTAFVLSTHPANLHSNHYLIPLYTALPVIVGTGLLAWRRFGRWAPLWAALALTGFYVADNLRFDVAWKYLTPNFRLQRLPDPWQPLVAYLDEHGITGGYGSYWVAYRTTFASKERTIIDPYPYHLDWNRYPRYTEYVGTLHNPAYLFFQHEGERAALKQLLAKRGIPFVEKPIGRFVVVHSKGSSGFYNYRADPAPVPLPDSGFRSEFVAYQVPPKMKPGQAVSFPVTIRNVSDQRWPARVYYLDNRYRVQLAYHWADDQDRMVVFNGQRSRLADDLRPGEEVTTVMTVIAPVEEGNYRLILTLVQELVDWFDQRGGNVGIQDVEIKG